MLIYASFPAEYLPSAQEFYGDKFSQIFKIITSDNGNEFAELTLLEKSTSAKYTSLIPTAHGKEVLINIIIGYANKGKKIDKYTSEKIMYLADQCNLLFRRILVYKTPVDIFDHELDKIFAI